MARHGKLTAYPLRSIKFMSSDSSMKIISKDLHSLLASQKILPLIPELAEKLTLNRSEIAYQQRDSKTSRTQLLNKSTKSNSKE